MDLFRFPLFHHKIRFSLHNCLDKSGEEREPCRNG